jgi:HEAT repeat protein
MLMLTKHTFVNRVTSLIQNCQDSVRWKFENDIEILYKNNIDNYEKLLDAIDNILLSTEIRTIACWLVSKVGDEDSVLKLLTASKDNSPAVRRQAIQALGELNFAYSQVLATINQALFDDNDSEVRKSAAYSIGLLAHQDSLSPLLNTLNNKSEDPSVRGMAIEALISFHDRSVISLLISLLSDEEAEVRFWSVFALGQLGAKDALPELKRLSREDHTEVLGWHKVSQEATSAIQIINQALNDADFEAD